MPERSADRDVLERLIRAADNFYRGRGYLAAFQLKCAINAAKKHVGASR